MYSQATVSAVLVVTDDWSTLLTEVATLFNRLHIQRLSLSASSLSGAPPGGEVIPSNPCGWGRPTELVGALQCRGRFDKQHVFHVVLVACTQRGKDPSWGAPVATPYVGTGDSASVLRTTGA